MSEARNIVLVHGGFVDGSGWEGVYHLLEQDGFNVRVVQNLTLSLHGDAAATRHVLNEQDGPTILVGHSYGGAVITEAGTHDNVAGLVYIAAFAPDQGESVSTLIADPPPGAPVLPSCPRRTASCSSTARSSPPRSPRTFRPHRPPSWPTHNSRGAWTPSTVPSATRPGAPSPAGTSSPPTTG